ncbi:hypothetical protein B566_EDAN011204, partial [Ephemera danica]
MPAWRFPCVWPQLPFCPSSWLENTSFIPALTDAPRSKSPPSRAESPIESYYRSSHKHKKSKKHKRKSNDDSLMLNDYAGKRFSRTHCRPLGWSPTNYKGKRKRRSRYFNSKLHEVVDLTGEDEERPSWNHDIHQELKSTTEELNSGEESCCGQTDLHSGPSFEKQPCLFSTAQRKVADELAADLRKRLDLQPLLLEGWLELARIE